MSGGDGKVEIRAEIVGDAFLISNFVDCCKLVLCEVSLVLVFDALNRRVNAVSETDSCTRLLLSIKGSTKFSVLSVMDNLFFCRECRITGI